MGSDYGKANIESWETVNGIEVPMDSSGQYLNWEEVSEDRTEAKRLTDPYGVLQYGVGGEAEDGDFTVWLDFAELPDGRIVLDACWDSESGGTIDSFRYEVVSREEAAAAALAMCDEALDACFNNEVQHDEEGHNADAYHFARAVAKHCGVKGYAKMPHDRLRRGKVPSIRGKA
jgi:hypothetical protein